MPKYSITGSRFADVITIGVDGYTLNGAFNPLPAAQVAAGLSVGAGRGNDTVTGGSGPDSLYGDAGGDRLNGGDGFDQLFGGDGNDILFDSLTGAVFDGGRGTDTLNFTNSTTGVAVYSSSVETGVTIALSANSVSVTHNGQQFEGRVLNVENLIGSNFGDVLWGSHTSNVIRGGGGNDYLNGMGSGSDRDQLFGGGGSDVFISSQGVDEMTGNAGADRFVIDTTLSNQGQDIIFDYSAAEGDVLVFSYADSGPTWSAYDHGGTASLLATYSGDWGSGSVILVGVTDASSVVVQVTNTQYIYDSYA